MKVSVFTYDLRFKHPFVLAAGTRTHTPAVFLCVEKNGKTGWAEAALPPYFGLTGNEVVAHLKSLPVVSLLQSAGAIELNQILQTRYTLPQPVNALLVSALANLDGFLIQQGLYQCSITVSASPGKKAEELLQDQDKFGLVKIKIGSGNDKEFVEYILSNTSKPFCVDVNQGWKNRDEAARTCEWLEKKGCLLIEQPFEANDPESHHWLRQRITIPVIADESICTYADLEQYYQAFDGVNIKLLKCGGPVEAQRMLDLAHTHDLKTLIGCMSESSLGCASAARMAHMADYVDLDGPYLINNNPFTGYEINNGKIEIHKQGILPGKDFFTAFCAHSITLSD